ncbi:hypothetical protein GCM10023189_22480 [Nibrella saemangeumensis]|uniref:Uncharacterized protein n=1 Tax=Nibrella saemangeumensis TaxID=1084526 RepID=A0ABP8MUM9_9BACT
MKYLILMLALLPCRLQAQSTLVGLGDFIIGVTSPDSLGRLPFTEQELVVLKGTVAFPCEHIRVFTADSLVVGGLPITNLSLVFYEDQLFRITCDYTDRLQKAFIAEHGKGTLRPASILSLCTGEAGKRMRIETESWRDGDIVAQATHASGHNADCEEEQSFSLTIASVPVMAISSECNLEDLDLYFDLSWHNP